MTKIKGLDEDLAEAVSDKFFEYYKTWKIDHPDCGKKEQVN